MSRRAAVWFLVAFALLVAAAVLVGIAAVSFLSSLAPLYGSIVLSVAAIGCALFALARQVEDDG